MCIFKSTHFDREILIISKFGLVEKCSEGAGKILGLNEELNNKHIEDLLSLSFIDFPYYKKLQRKRAKSCLVKIYWLHTKNKKS